MPKSKTDDRTLRVDLETHRKLKMMSADFGVPLKEVIARVAAVIYNLPDAQKVHIKNMANVVDGSKS